MVTGDARVKARVIQSGSLLERTCCWSYNQRNKNGMPLRLREQNRDIKLKKGRGVTKRFCSTLTQVNGVISGEL